MYFCGYAHFFVHDLARIFDPIYMKLGKLIGNMVKYNGTLFGPNQLETGERKGSGVTQIPEFLENEGLTIHCAGTQQVTGSP